ncbi:hypothetical protein PHYSODRAFT_304351 [Phytophthora sojae]|uniref:Uncharacterized protein n=1 Tax=Phytophthora sojae (strain P6497) TaxID=1094619 RepID=G5A097_PHYSP|nr:hypothetical protein PHYSODRAFT_304351 [Phytophthora sojae]EGZ10486.1 hypothetical protein PHYSODRAFT_304351 [Phytophthora sojae]|eukprot:XP_009533231.1 hypothetical protein PHYSODRAFT_304351 [Phytophthora sojae]
MSFYLIESKRNIRLKATERGFSFSNFSSTTIVSHPMTSSNLIFGKPVMLQGLHGKTLFSPGGAEALLSKSVEGEDACVQLLRNDDGTVSIQSMRNKLFLSAREVEDDDDDDDEELPCRFDATEVGELQSFRVKLVENCAFVLKCEENGFHLERNKSQVECSDYYDEKHEAIQWTLKVPAWEASAQAALPSEASIPDAVPAQVVTDSQVMAISYGGLEKEALDKRHETIVQMVMAGKSVQYIDDILTRLYGSPLANGNKVLLN